MVLKRPELSDGLPMAEWQRRRSLQLGNGLAPRVDPDPGFSQSPLTDEMPMNEWQRARERQVRDGVNPGRPSDVGFGYSDLVVRPGDPPVRLVQLSAHTTKFAPMSERQWEVESARAAHQGNPQSNPRVSAEQWAIGRVGKGEYYRLGSNAPDAEGPVEDHLPPSLRGMTDPKCNQFVWDALTAGGVQPGRVDGGRIPLAKDWGDRTSKIGGYAPVSGPAQPGDVVSDGHHVGIYSPLPDGRPGTVSAASPYSGDAGWNGGVVHNDWGFRRSQGQMTVWRPVAAQRK